MIKNFWKGWARFIIRHPIIGDPMITFCILGTVLGILCLYYGRYSPNPSGGVDTPALVAFCMLALMISLICIGKCVSAAKEVLPEIALKKVTETEGFSEDDLAALRILEGKARLLDDATLLKEWLENLELARKGRRGMTEAVQLAQAA